MAITNCAFLLGSSIGLDQYLANRNISAVMNDLERIQLEAFTSQQAKIFLNELCKGGNLKLSSRSRNKMLELIGPPIPYLIQVFFSEMLKTNRIGERKITPEVVEDVYFEDILGVNSKGYFIHSYYFASNILKDWWRRYYGL